MRIQLLCLSFLLFSLSLSAQIVSLQPATAGPNDAATLVFDATQGNGELIGASKVYVHHGVVTDGPNGTNWAHVIGNWGMDDGIGQMSPVAGETDKWEISFSPSIRDHFGVPGGTNIFRLALVFRSSDGNTKGTIAPGAYGWGTVTANQDIYLNLNSDHFVSMTNPTASLSYLNPGDSLEISAVSSTGVDQMTLTVDNGSGATVLGSVNSGTSISEFFVPDSTSVLDIKVEAIVGTDTLTTNLTHNVVIVQATVVQALPQALLPGIHYDPNDATHATLILEAPGKTYGYLVGDFSDWYVQDKHQLKQTPDGEFLWTELTGLTPQQPYVFQYWIEQDVKIGDPYAEQVADPWNDHLIDGVTFPNVPNYTRTEFHTATVLQTGGTAFSWAASEDSWQRPDVDHLVIYELLIRDFLASHSYTDLIDTLDYIKNLGVDAIELMPFSEFEGNESWGYNPSYYFAVDKYYGTRDQLKQFIQAAHQKGLAVIMDMVMNHAFGQNPMVKLYFDEQSFKPTASNPWFNQDHVGQYQWGFDWNHESGYTERFLDRLNAFWMEEYHIDGYRFDFTKGFTQNAPGGSVDGYDQSRIDIMKRMADEIWAVDPQAYIILEHWAPYAEEQILGDYGMKMWSNRSYDYVPATIGNPIGGFGGMDRQEFVSFFDSHDERRIAEHAITEGWSNDLYRIKDLPIMYERMKMAAGFTFLIPGPKMLWQFDELGYDIDINFNGRVGNKPLPWGPGSLRYYEDSLRYHIYQAYQGILQIRRSLNPDLMAQATTSHKLDGNARRLVYDMPGTDLVVVGNFGLNDAVLPPAFTQTGTWYEYFSGDSIEVLNVNTALVLKAGEWHIYTSNRMGDGMPGVVEVYDNPVSISPFPFTKSDQITLTFDAKKAFPNGTSGLVGANKVYMHSGVVKDHPDSTNLTHIIGTLMDDGIGEMTAIGNDQWELTFTPTDYYGLSAVPDIFQLGMYFRDENNVELGYGFRNQQIFVPVASDRPFVSIEPASFSIDDEITITFNARKGNEELLGESKVYMHSGVDLMDTNTPWITGWQNVIGNWGMDDGVGEMQASMLGDDLWEITLVPRTYYGLQNGDVMHWLCSVFRSADGNKKGTGTPGPIDNGIIHTNLDFFIENQFTVHLDELLGEETISIFPNPATDQIHLHLEKAMGNDLLVRVTTVDGKLIRQMSLDCPRTPCPSAVIDISQLSAGFYWLQIVGEKGMLTHKLIKQ
ncbi:MAG: alpha-amylase family glycosyl hydrolase [Bacteroidota bacterium]